MTDQRQPPRTIPELFAASVRAYGQLPALLAFRQRRWQSFSYRQIKEQADQVASGLLTLGLKRGDRVGILSENRPEWGIAYLAIAAIGCVVVPLDMLLKSSEHEEILRDAEIRAVFASGQFLPQLKALRPLVPTLRFLISLEETADRAVVSWSQMTQRTKGQLAFIGPKPDDLLALIYTSGTMSTAKGVMLSQKNITANVAGCAEVVIFGPQDRFLSVLPLSHTYECTAGFLVPLAKGAAVAYARSLKSKEILEDIGATGATLMLGVPLLFEKNLAGIWRGIGKQPFGKRTVVQILYRLVKVVKRSTGINLGIAVFSGLRRRAGLGALRMFVCGGAPLDPATAEGFDLLGIKFLQGYGLTETAPVLTVNPDYKQKYASVGKPIPGVELAIINPDGRGVGEIAARGDSVMLGYYKNPKATAQVLRDGWFFTGDAGWRDHEGYYYITGRLKNVIVTPGGKNVYPEEVEHHLMQSPFILEVLVHGQKVSGGEEVEATVVPDQEYFADFCSTRGGEATPETMEATLKSEIARICAHLADYKRVKRFQIRLQEFDKTASRKIKRRQITPAAPGVSVPAGVMATRDSSP